VGQVPTDLVHLYRRGWGFDDKINDGKPAVDGWTEEVVISRSDGDQFERGAGVKCQHP